MKKVSVIIPCYNSTPLLDDTLPELNKLIDELYHIGYQPELVFIEDGSSDATLDQLLAFQATHTAEVCVVQLTGNFGSYNALLAGCHYATGDCMIQLHDDLQDPPHYIPQMLRHWEAGFKLVIGNRVERNEPMLRKLFSAIYHWSIKTFALPHIPPGGYDLVLFDKEIRNHLVALNESNTNLIYLISWLRYPYVTVPVTRQARRMASRWKFFNLIKLVIDSFISFSYTPVRVVGLFAISSVAVFVACTAFLMIESAFPFIYWLLSLLGMLLLVSLSIVAEYLYRILHNSQKRPPFVVYKKY